jgi:hypothetical protein
MSISKLDDGRFQDPVERLLSASIRCRSPTSKTCGRRTHYIHAGGSPRAHSDPSHFTHDADLKIYRDPAIIKLADGHALGKTEVGVSVWKQGTHCDDMNSVVHHSHTCSAGLCRRV